MEKFFYLLRKPKVFKSTITNKDHSLCFDDNRVYISPKRPTSKHVNPRSIYKLKKEFNIKEITIYDRVKNIKREACIVNHVNRAGTSFLIGNTPFNCFPRFPDMTKIYNKIKGMDRIVVHTVGPLRFEKFLEKNILISESIGLIAPIWYYVGTKIFARTHINEKN